MLPLNEKLSANFTFGEMIRSEPAERIDALMLQQETPLGEVVEALMLLCEATLQPIRDRVQGPVAISSAYRCCEVNTLVGGSPTSAHCKGEAADLVLPSGAGIRDAMDYVNQQVMDVTKWPIRTDVNLNFYLFALICLNLEKLDIDQVIHEYGPAYGQPAWVHVSSSERQNKREILVTGRYVKNGARTRILYVEEALKLGV